MHARADMPRALNKANLDPEDRAAFASECPITIGARAIVPLATLKSDDWLVTTGAPGTISALLPSLKG
jgi:hypothetical protein